MYRGLNGSFSCLPGYLKNTLTNSWSYLFSSLLTLLLILCSSSMPIYYNGNPRHCHSFGSLPIYSFSRDSSKNFFPWVATHTSAELGPPPVLFNDSLRALLLPALFSGMSILDSFSYDEFLKNFRWLCLFIVKSWATVLVIISFKISNSISVEIINICLNRCLKEGLWKRNGVLFLLMYELYIIIQIWMGIIHV